MQWIKTNTFVKKMFGVGISYFVSTSLAFGHPETLKEAYCTMLNTNPSLFESVANQKAAYQTWRNLHGGLWPTLALAYSVGRGKGESISPQTLPIGYTVANIQHKMISVSQLIFDGGALAFKVESARTQFEVAKHQTCLQRNVLALRVVSAYLAILRSKEMAVVAHKNLRMHLRRLHQAEERYRRGATILSELSIALSKTEQVRLIVNQTELDLENARATFREVVGHYPADELVDPHEPTHLIPGSLIELEKLSNLNNPSIRAEKCSIASAHDLVKSARSVLIWPNVVLQASISRDHNLNGIEQKTTSMQGYLAFTYNLFHGGADIADMKKAAAQLFASKARYESRQREVRLAVEQTWNEMQISKKDMISLQRHLSASRQAASAVDQELLLGKRSLLDIMEIENELYNVRLALVNTKYKIKIDTYSLVANSGLLADYLLNA